MQSTDPHRGDGARSGASAFRLHSPLLRTLTGACLAGTLTAQTAPRLVVSTTGDLAASGGLVAINDETLVAVGGGRAPAPQFSENHWLAQAGFVPGDIDGYARLDSFPPGDARSNVFSTLANDGGFLDGDLLTFDEGGGVHVVPRTPGGMANGAAHEGAAARYVCR